jgi:hypothetical protein
MRSHIRGLWRVLGCGAISATAKQYCPSSSAVARHKISDLVKASRLVLLRILERTFQMPHSADLIRLQITIADFGLAPNEGEVAARSRSRWLSLDFL